MSLSLRLAQRHVAYSLVHNRAAEDDAERIAAYATLRKSAPPARPTLFNVQAFKAECALGSPHVVRARTEPQSQVPRPSLRAYHSHSAVRAPVAPAVEEPATVVAPCPRIAALVQQVCADAAPVRLARQIRARCA